MSAVASIVHNETYTGTWYYRKNMSVKGNGKSERKVRRDRSEWLPVAVPAIIDAETFAQTQAACERNRWMSPRNTRNEYLVRGLVRCACGYACCIRNDRSRPRTSYQCTADSNLGAPRCPDRLDVRTERLDAAVWQALVDLLLDEKMLRQAIQQQRARAQVDQAPLTVRLDALSVTRAGVERKLAILVDQLLDGDFPKSIIDERRQLLMGTLRTIEAEERRVRTELASASLTPAAEESLVQMAAQIRQGAAALSFEERRQVVLMLQVEVTLLSKTQAKVACLLPIAQEVIELERAPQNKGGEAVSSPPGGPGAQDGPPDSVDPSGGACTFVSTVSITP